MTLKDPPSESDGCEGSFMVPFPQAYLLVLHPLMIIVLVGLLVSLSMLTIPRYGFNDGIDQALLIVLGSIIGTIIGVSIVGRQISYEISIDRILIHQKSKSRPLIEPRDETEDVHFEFTFRQPFYLKGADFGFIYVMIPVREDSYFIGAYSKCIYNNIIKSYSGLAVR